MPNFQYEALDKDGKLIRGVLTATSTEAAISELRSSHHTVTKIREQKDHLVLVRELFKKSQKISLYTVALFTRQLATMINSGIPLIRGLQAMSEQSLDKKFSEIVGQIHDEVQGGISLTRALQKHPGVFSPIYLTMVRSGEISGSLGEVMDRLANLLEREYGLRKKVESAMSYPIFIFFASIGITLFIMNVIFPQFISLLEGINVTLPPTTRFLILVNSIFREKVVMGLIIVVFGVGIYLLKQYIETPTGKRQKDLIMLSIPVVGKVNKAVAMSRFCRTLGSLTESGVPVVQAMDVVAKVSGNEIINDILDEVKDGLRGGLKLSEPLRANKEIFPPMVSHMIAVGEETGKMSDILQKLANSFDVEVEAALDALISMIEPILILSMGVVVGFVLISVFMPIYSVLNNFSN